MKYSKKWKVVPYEQVTETIQQNDANELEKLKQILENPSTSEEEKYNLYNSNLFSIKRAIVLSKILPMIKY